MLVHTTKSVVRNAYLSRLAATVIILAVTAFSAIAQNTPEQEAAYQKTITERAAKIVNTLGINDSGRFKEVTATVANQYFALNALQNETQKAIAAVKTAYTEKAQQEEPLKKIEDKKTTKVKQLHAAFIVQLNKQLTPGQVEKVKDGMTYSVLPKTYAAYQEMLLQLTPEQKKQIYAWLEEARELAMDAETSDKKHAVFGKYKGKINNYLSAAGYDMKKEGEEWQKRIKAREQNNNTK